MYLRYGMANLFDKIKLGDLELNNRIFMAPLTRARAKIPGNIPYELNAKYYGQRSSAGLIISEGTQISKQGQGYKATPGIYSKEQVEGWKLVTNEVHKRKGKIFCQLWHVGRISDPSYQPDNNLPVAPSAIKPKGKHIDITGKERNFITPKELTKREIQNIVFDYKNATINAKDSGFDGVEIHAANGYLIDQFLQNNSNKRGDEYGGSLSNRCRFLIDIIDEVSKIFSSTRIGVRLSPYGTFNDMNDNNPGQLFQYILSQLSKKNLAYIHLIEPRAGAGKTDNNIEGSPDVISNFRDYYKGFLISAGGYDPVSAFEAIKNELSDAIAFGRLFIANPDLPERIESGYYLNKYDRKTFYVGGKKGYTDYPIIKL